jgi:hypothetical protein
MSRGAVTGPALATLSAERTTAVTDLLLALVVGVGIIGLRHRAPPGWRREVWTTALGVFGMSALLGAVAHGLELDDRTRDALWQPLYLLLGLAVSLFVVGAVGDWRGERAGRAILPAAIVAAVVFYLATRVTAGDFRVFVAFEAGALLFALGVYGALARLGRPGAAMVAAALTVSLAAGAVQATDSLTVRLGWEFDHNGLYHLVQIVGVVLLVRGLTATPR